MSDEISQARQALRDYARDRLRVTFPPQFNDAGHAVSVKPGEPISTEIFRGEVGAKAFQAAQNALTVAEELREEGAQPLSEGDPRAVLMGPDEQRAYRMAQREAADRIEAAILKALG